MPPTTSKPRLAQLDPAAVAREVCDQVLAHLRAVAWQLDPTMMIPDPTLPQLAWSVQALAEYAQTGRDAETDDPQVASTFARDRIGDVLAVLFGCAAEPHSISTAALDPEVDPDTAIGCVLLAAWARTLLAAEEPISRRQIAALAGVDPDHVGLLARRGELRIADGLVGAAEARRWLSGRGVAA